MLIDNQIYCRAGCDTGNGFCNALHQRQTIRFFDSIDFQTIAFYEAILFNVIPGHLHRLVDDYG